MADSTWTTNLLQCLICPFCKDLFRDPVMLQDCGHSLCRECVNEMWDTGTEPICCPKCEMTVSQRTYIPNQTLVDMTEIAKKMDPGTDMEMSQAPTAPRCCAPSCDRKAVQVHMQFCFKHLGSFSHAMDCFLHHCKGHWKTSMVSQHNDRNWTDFQSLQNSMALSGHPSQDQGHEANLPDDVDSSYCDGTESGRANAPLERAKPIGRRKLRVPSGFISAVIKEETDSDSSSVSSSSST